LPIEKPTEALYAVRRCLLDKLTATFASPLAPGRLSGRRKVPRLRSQRREAHKVLTLEWT
jgi:hypothetical protein